MAAWTGGELAAIEGTDELHMQTRRPDGGLRNPVTMWVVRVGDDLYVRSVRGTGGLWYRHATERNEARVRSGGVTTDVTLARESDADVNERIDAAYRAKYQQRYPDNIVATTLTDEARASTLKLRPQGT